MRFVFYEAPFLIAVTLLLNILLKLQIKYLNEIRSIESQHSLSYRNS